MPAAAPAKVSARDAAISALADGTPKSASDIIDAVIATRGVTLGGKTPRATVQAILSTEAKKEEGAIERVETGVYKKRG